MWYTYTLISVNSKRLYKGHTNNIKRRLQEHNDKKGGGYTSKNAPFELIHYEAFLNKEEAIKQEKFYKSGYGREVLNDKLNKTLLKYNN